MSGNQKETLEEVAAEVAELKTMLEQLTKGVIPKEEIQLLTIKELTELLQISHVTLNRLVKLGEFPQPVRIKGSDESARAVRFRTVEVLDWIKLNQQ
ncbi:TPA: helix-turn-helix transcriptional regulator [Vibrio cholerae]